MLRQESARQVSLAAGLSESALTKVESGRTKEVSLSTFARIAKALGLTEKEVWVLVNHSAVYSPCVSDTTVAGGAYDSTPA
jgi:transcriptional regulator with XRE-family HTH domain